MLKDIVGETFGPDVDPICQIQIAVPWVPAYPTGRVAQPRPGDEAIPEIHTHLESVVLIPLLVDEVVDIRPTPFVVASAPVPDRYERLSEEV